MQDFYDSQLQDGTKDKFYQDLTQATPSTFTSSGLLWWKAWL
ncbi:MAG TPA: hypothetical protein PK299_05465 [Anaerolineales bacterium]|nr:hypothetical protein [Anaerolineales bacterium]